MLRESRDKGTPQKSGYKAIYLISQKLGSKTHQELKKCMKNEIKHQAFYNYVESGIKRSYQFLHYAWQWKVRGTLKLTCDQGINLLLSGSVVVVWQLDLQLRVQSVYISPKVVSSNTAQERCTGYNNVIKFVSAL